MLYVACMFVHQVWQRQLDADTELLLVHADVQYSSQILLLSQGHSDIAAAKSGRKRQRQQLASTCYDGKQWLLYATTTRSAAHSNAAYTVTVQQPVYQCNDCTDDPELLFNWYVASAWFVCSCIACWMQHR
jgi:hypothetical protein